MKTLIINFMAALLLLGCSRAVKVQPAERYHVIDEFHHPEDQAINDKMKYTPLVEIMLSSSNHDLIHKQILTMANRFEAEVTQSAPNLTRLRVPMTNFELVLIEIEQLGEVIKFQFFANNRSLKRLRETEVRLNTSRESLQRYLHIFELAEDPPQMQSIQKDIERLKHQIDQYIMNIEQLERSAKSGSITIKTRLKPNRNPVASVFNGIYAGLKWFFVGD
jgi:hypothetical protein